MSEIKPINISTSCFDETANVVKKPKKIKLIIEEEEKCPFIPQIFRKDILANMLANTQLFGRGLFELLMNEKLNVFVSSKTTPRQGYIFETICQILIILKCVENINYKEIYEGHVENLNKINNVKLILNKNVTGQGNNKVDFTIKQCDTYSHFSIKYKPFCETDICNIIHRITEHNVKYDYKIGLIVKDKEEFINHRYIDDNNTNKHDIAKINENGLLFDKKDIVRSLDIFCQSFSNNKLNIDDFIEMVNTDYLLSPRVKLIKKLHQKITEMNFIKTFLKNKHKMWCICHKPRSGKSITMILICKYLLENGYNKILIMTSVPSTINSFVKDLENYIDFKNINYKLQKDFTIIEQTFNGIVFCSTEYLKTNKKQKKEYLKKIGFNAIFIDESHLGGSTYKTKTDILDVVNDIEDIRDNIKLNIFASGTADKTKKYYGIDKSCINEWEIQDEARMKKLTHSSISQKDRDDIINCMVQRHGDAFLDCFNDNSLNKDYSNCPIQVLMKHSIPQSLIDKIKSYNSKNGTSFGYNCASLLALIKSKKSYPEKDERGEVIKTKEGYDYYEYEYKEEFELTKTQDGCDILKGFFKCIISNDDDDAMAKTIMKQIETTQTIRSSRKSSKECPLLFIIYLPTNTRNNTISLLQKTMKQFIEYHGLWSEYNIEYSNSKDDTGCVKEEYDVFIKKIMTKTKNDNKKGCILLLGNKGSVGITYHHCDVTISLDDGHNLDNQKQRFSRALTDAPGKTIGINVDMNIQRTYLYLLDIIQKHIKNTKTTKSNAEILHFLFEQNIFLFNPQEINNGNLRTIDIISYYQKEAEEIWKSLDDTSLLDNLNCNDDMRDILIKMIIENKIHQKKIDSELVEGDQQDCPKGDKTMILIDSPVTVINEENKDVDDIEEDTIIDEKEKIVINKTLELCKYLFPYLSLLGKSFKIFDFKEILIHEKTKIYIISFLNYKKIEVNNDNYYIIVNIMNVIIDNNEEIINNIREIYSIAQSVKLRLLIEKHFIPTSDEKKRHAEVPSPVIVIEEMLDTLPKDFWETPKKVFEPCCGKGNFVLGIFDRFYKGLENMYPDEIDRCKVIMTQCIYYADLTALNVFITTEILKCHIQHYCGLDELDYDFNTYTGNTLELNIRDQWNIHGFDAICGNPPYDDPNATGDNKLYLEFIQYSLGILKKDMYLLFVTPTNIKNYITNKDKNRKYIDKFYEIVYLSLNTVNRHFKGINTYFAYFLIKNTVVTTCKTKVEFLRNKIIEKDEITIVEKQELPLCLSNTDLYIINKCSNILSNLHETFDIKKATYLINKKQTLQRIRKTHIINGDISETLDNCYKHPIINKINKSTPFPGDVYYNKHLMIQHGLPKIVMCTGGYLMPSYDEFGEYNLSDNMIYLLCDTKEKYNGFVILVNSKLIKYLNLITMTDNIHGRDTVIQNIKAINLEEITSEEMVFKLYNLSEIEIALIHKTINK
jgi:hypothetical protein